MSHADAASSASLLLSSHGHWDCYHGVSTHAMLQACLNINPSSRETLEAYIVQHVEPIANQIFSETINVGQVLSQQQQQHEGDTNTIPTKSVKLSRLLDVLSMESDVSLPPCVQSIVKTTFTEVEQALTLNKTEEPCCVSLETVLETIATALALDRLKVSTFSCSPIPVVFGPTQNNSDSCEPTPSHAVMQLLIGMPTYSPKASSAVPLLTLTGLALLKALTTRIGTLSETTQLPSCFTPRAVGIGSSSQEADKNNAAVASLRLIIGDDNENTTLKIPDTISNSNYAQELNWKMDKLVHLTTNVDDTTPEVLAFVVDKLLQSGAADSWVQPIVMKKGRPAHALHCLAVEKEKDTAFYHGFMEIIFRETGTLGIRIQRNLDRAALYREMIPVQTPYTSDAQTKGIVNVKVGYFLRSNNKEPVSVKAEFDHCQSISRATGVPLKQIAASATNQVWATLRNKEEHDHYRHPQG